MAEMSLLLMFKPDRSESRILDMLCRVCTVVVALISCTVLGA